MYSSKTRFESPSICRYFILDWQRAWKISIRALSVVSVLFVVFSQPAVAYIESKLSKRPVQDLVSNSDHSSFDSSNSLVLSDNDEFHSHFFGSSPVPRSELEHFIFADYMPLVEVVTRSNERSLPTEFSVEELLYANLKLAALLKEYESLQKNASQVLEGLDIPFFRWDGTHLQSLGTDHQNLTQRLNLIKNRSGSMTGFGSIEVSGPRLTPDDPKARFKNPTLNRHSFNQLPAIGQQHQSFLRTPISRAHHHDSSKEAEKGGNEEKSKVDISGKQNDDKPWPIRLIIFIFSDKLLAIFFFFVIYVAFWFLSVIRKR